MVHSSLTSEDSVGLVTHINDLPNEILIIIFSLIDYESLLCASEVCQRWRDLSISPGVWDDMKLVVSLKNYHEITEKVLPMIHSNLKIIKLQYFKLYSKIRVPLLKLCPNINHLEITISQIDECIFDDLKSWPDLKFLSFRNSLISKKQDSDSSNSTFNIPFEFLLKLEKLILSNFALSLCSLMSMLDCKYLNYINMEKMKNIPTHFLQSLVLSKLQTLKVLCIYGDSLTDDVVSLISKCECLSVLHITTCKTLFDSSLVHLASLKTLKSLKLRHGYFSTAALVKYFSNNNFQKLTFLSLSRCLHVTMQVVLLIKESAPNLNELSFYQCPFVMDKSPCRSDIFNLFNIPILID